LWEEFLLAFERGAHRQVYRAASPPGLTGLPQARKDLFQRSDYSGVALVASRGCASHCDFCTLKEMYRGKARFRPVAEVAAEYASFCGKVIIFWDDNIAGDLDYAKALFRAIAPYHKWWSSQASVHVGQDDEFLELAAHSGCKQLFLGFESLSQESLRQAGKRFNQVGDYARIIRRVHAHGIAVQAGIVFGFDQDTPAIFDATVDFLEENGVQNATFNILTPFPGTDLYRRLDAEGRILSRDWRAYNSRSDVVFQPRQMSREQLLEGFRAACRRFYSPAGIARRLARSPVGLWWTLPLNLAYLAALWRHGFAPGILAEGF
jgi:radical SAM superfamily enzyme YgiQ (UPF0313 family)